MLRIKNCLISVYNKEGIAKFAKDLHKLGIKIYASEGTSRFLREKGVEVLSISEITKFEELLGGKIKTLHPEIFKRILSTHEEAEKLGIDRFDMLVIDLYPPENEPDIGGVSLIRAGIKLGKETVVIVSPEDYSLVSLTLKNTGGIPDDLREKLNKKAGIYVLKYQIENYVKYFGWELLPYLFNIEKELRYGTNPSRRGFIASDGTYTNFEVLKGDLSYNNVYDADSSLRCALALKRILGKLSACIVKHGTPCGVSVSEDPAEAIRRAWESDPISAYGGIIALSFPVEYSSAHELEGKFFEVIVAPQFDSKSIEILMKKKARIIRAGEHFTEKIAEIRSVLGNFIAEFYSDNEEDVKESDFKPTYEFEFFRSDIQELMFSYTVARFVKSNAVVVSSGFQTLGIGGGFTSRVDATRFALMKTKEFLKKQGVRIEKFYISSDGFFPFADSIEIIHNEIKAISPNSEIFVAQPGGSIRDEEVFRISEKLKIKMFTTGKRCFRH